MPKQLPTSLTFTTDLVCQKESASQPTFFLEANSGAPMDVGGYFEKVVVDLAGAKFDKSKTPVIAGHQSGGLGLRIGHTTDQEIIRAGETKQVGGKPVEGPQIAAAGIVSSGEDAAKAFTDDAKAGFPFQVSIGADIDQAHMIKEGDSETINGTKHEGPLIVASKTRIRELSVCVLGADNNTSALVAAATSKQQHNTDREGLSMPPTFDEYLKTLEGAFGQAGPTSSQKDTLKASYDKMIAAMPKKEKEAEKTPAKDDSKDDKQPLEVDLKAERQKLAAEQERVTALRATSSKYEGNDFEAEIGNEKLNNAGLLAKAIGEGWTVEKHELECFRHAMPKAPAIHSVEQVRDMDGKVLSCAIVRSQNIGVKVPYSKENDVTGEKYGIEHWYPEKVLQASDHRDLRNVTLHQIFDMFIEAAGERFSGSRKSDAFLKATRQALRKLNAAGFTTHTAVNIFDDAANKMMLAGYEGVSTVWQEVAQTKSVNDFKQGNLYRLTTNGAYQQVGADGELQHGTLTDTKWTHAADTYGKIYQLTRKHLINDDLGAFGQLMMSLGREGARSLEELVLVEIQTQIGTMWVAGNNNYLSGTTSDLSIEGLSRAAQLFEDQTEDDAPIGIEPDRILVGTQDRVKAGELFNKTEVREGRGSSKSTEQFTSNPHVSAFRPIVSPYLNNANVKQRVHDKGDAVPNQTTDHWFMFPNPNMAQGASFIVSLLNGNATPILEQSDVDFEFLGMRWRAYHDFGVDPADPILSVHSKGTT